MKAYTECIPCFVRQALDAVRMATKDETVHVSVLREALRLASEVDMTQPPPAIGQLIHRLIRKRLGVADPYRAIKQQSNRIGLRLYDELKGRVAQSDDPLQTAARLAIAGNIIDFGKRRELKESEIDDAIREALTVSVDMEMFESFRAAVRDAKDILYLADNAGEIVLDRLLIERIGPQKVTVVVRGEPVINDATLDDARAAGMTELVDVIDNGSDAPGTILPTCSGTFRGRFRSAGLIIAKGQGNYETLNDEPGRIFFLLKVKCPVIADDVGCPLGSFAILQTKVV